MRIGVLTGGGDVPGLNPAIRAVTRRALEYGWEVLGIKNGWLGLVEGDAEPFDLWSVSGILPVGGTILGSSRTNPFGKDRDTLLPKVLENYKKFQLDALIPIGGDDTLGVGLKLYEEFNIPVVGIPKTMDNDVGGTDYCIGFDTAVSIVADALDKLHTTASSHHRAFVVEVMGRDAGWVATVGGLAGGADLIIIPEVEMSMDEICAHLEKRRAIGKNFAIIVVAEGAKIKGMEIDEEGIAKDAFGHIRLDMRGIGARLAREIEQRTGFETRSVVLGHLQRGGSPTAWDRVLATRLGVFAVDMVKERMFGQMAAIRGNQIVAVPLRTALATNRTVDLEIYKIAKVFY